MNSYFHKNKNLKTNGCAFIFVFYVLIILFFLLSWVVNVYKLTQLDFAPIDKAEIIRFVSIIPIIAPFSAWQDIGEEEG